MSTPPVSPEPQQPQQPQQPQYAPPPEGTPYSAPQVAPPQVTQPQYTQPQYGQPQYGQPQYAQVQYMHYQQVPAGGFGAPGPGEPFDGAIDPNDLSRPLYGATFGQAVRRFFKNYATFSGRASRSEYWWVALFVFLIELLPLALYVIGLVMMIGGGVGMATSRYGNSNLPGSSSLFGIGVVLLFVGLGLLLVIALGLLVPSIAIMWRRLHDSNQPGPMYFLGFIPYAGAIILFVFSLLPPKPQGRRFDRTLR